MPGGNVGRGIALDVGACFKAIGHWTYPAVRCGWNQVSWPGMWTGQPDGQACSSLRYRRAPTDGTVGGMVANNASGARTFRYGATRDWVEALDVVTADGSQYRLDRGETIPPEFRELHTELRAELGSEPEGWPNVRKNSSGYALDRFLRGGRRSARRRERGTIAVVTSVTLALASLPETQAVALIPLRNQLDLPILLQWAHDNEASACEFFGRRLLEVASLTGHALAGAAVEGAEAALLLELDGDQDSVSTAAESLRILTRELGLQAIVGMEEIDRRNLWSLRHAASPLIAESARAGLVSTQIIEDSVVPPEALGAYLSGLDEILQSAKTDAVIFGHAGDANVHVNPLLDVRRPSWRDQARTILKETADLVAELGGTLSGEHGDGRLRAPFVEQIWGSKLTECFERTKATLDPSGILNPGVIIPRPGQDPLEGLWPQFGGSA